MGCVLSNKPVIFNYLDYRKFLREYYAYMKETSPDFSYRNFAKKAGLRTPNYLKQFLDGKFNLTKPLGNKFARGCEFNKNEKEFFFRLIDFARTKNITIKTRHLKKLSELSLRNSRKEIRYEQYELLSKWYYIVVRSLIDLPDFRPEPEYITGKLKGFVTPGEAVEAFDTLIKTGLVREVNGKYVLDSQHINIVDEIQTPAIQNFHSQMIPVGVKALRNNLLKDREIRALTVGVNPKIAQEAKQRIKEFYGNLVSFINSSMEGEPIDDVWQLNFQFFKFTGGGMEK